MNYTKKLTLALAALTVAGVLQAQQTTAPAAASTDNSPGVIGKDYVQVSGSDLVVSGISSHGYELGAAVNDSVASWLDVGAFYDYAWLNDRSTTIEEHTNTLGADATAYLNYNGIKPFVSAAIAYEADEASINTPFAQSSSTHYGEYQWSAGVEIPYEAIALTPSIAYQDDFRQSADSVQAWIYGIDVNYWISAGKVGVFADYNYVNVLRAGGSEDAYTVGLRFKF